MATGGTYDRSITKTSDVFYNFPCLPCSDDGKNAEALYQCVVCQIFYCQKCVETHNKFTKNHKVLDQSSDRFGQAPKLTDTYSCELPTDICENDHGEVIKMYSGRHDMVFCSICIAMNHRNCFGVEHIPNTANGLKKTNKKKTKVSLEIVKDELKNLKSKMQNEIKKLNQEPDAMVDDIQKIERRDVARIEQLEEPSPKDVRENHQEITGKIHANETTIADMLTEVESRLSRLNLSKKDNYAQTFVEKKYAEKTTLLGNECAKKCSQKHFDRMYFEEDSEIETYLDGVTSLGILEVSDRRLSQVNIVLPHVGKNPVLVEEFILFLQEKLQKAFKIESDLIRQEDIVSDQYNIVVIEPGDDMGNKAMKNIARKHDQMIILVKLLTDYLPLYTSTDISIREFKALFKVHVENDDTGFSFHCRNNQKVIESIAKIVKSGKRMMFESLGHWVQRKLEEKL